MVSTEGVFGLSWGLTLRIWGLHILADCRSGWRGGGGYLVDVVGCRGRGVLV